MPHPSVTHANGIRVLRMRAIVQTEYGAADVLRVAEIDRPAIADDEVLVRVHAAGLDRGTWHLMAGQAYLIRLMGYGLRAPKNRVPGLDVAGTVVEIGTDVTRFAVGDDVFGVSRGSFAEYACAREDKLARKPANLTFDQAAVVAISGLTALQGLCDVGRLEAGQRVLIIGASGGVGTLRRADRQGGRSRGHRGVQHREARPGPLARRRPRHRLHQGRLLQRTRAPRPDPRHRRQLLARHGSGAR